MAKLLDVKDKYFQELVLKDPELANNQEIDNNKIEEMLKLQYILKFFNLLILLCNIVYFFSIFWLLSCNYVNGLLYQGENHPNFIMAFGLGHKLRNNKTNVNPEMTNN